MKFAYFGLPHVGGTYSLFRYLRAGLALRGIELRWLGRGPWEGRNDPAWQDDLAFGEVVETAPSEPEWRQAAALVKAIRDGGYDGVFVNVLADIVQTNAVRYLPADVLRIMIVHSISPGTYAGARAVRDHVHAAVGVSARCRHDLVEGQGFPAGRTFAILSPVDVARLASRQRASRTGEGLRLLYLGRVEEGPKGVLWLPKILDALDRRITLTVAGDGPDLARLKNEMSRHGDRVTFLGRVDSARVPELFASHDVAVAPSRFEGFGLSAVEAMAGGCVPVVSRIRLVTDEIIDHGENGFLFPVGAWAEAADCIRRLDKDRALLERMSRAAREKAVRAFDIASAAESYAGLIRRIAAAPPRIAAPLDLGQWKVPAGLRPGLRTYLPRGVKNWLRVLREQVAS